MMKTAQAYGESEQRGEDMIIELAEDADAQAVLDLQRLAYVSEAELYNDYSIPPLTQTLEEMQSDFRRQVVYRATIDGRIIGSVRGHLEDGTCHIGRLIVHPDFQNRGIGTALMARVEQHFTDAVRFELFTGDISEHNLYLYGKLGYHVFDTKHLTDKVTIVLLEKSRDADAQ